MCWTPHHFRTVSVLSNISQACVSFCISYISLWLHHSPSHPSHPFCLLLTQICTHDLSFRTLECFSRHVWSGSHPHFQSSLLSLHWFASFHFHLSGCHSSNIIYLPQQSLLLLIITRCWEYRSERDRHGPRRDVRLCTSNQLWWVLGGVHERDRRQQVRGMRTTWSTVKTRWIGLYVRKSFSKEVIFKQGIEDYVNR